MTNNFLQINIQILIALDLSYDISDIETLKKIII